MIKSIKKILRMLLLTIIGAVLLVTILVILFVNLSPEFGGKATDEDLKKYNQSAQFTDGLFKNSIPTTMDMDAKTMFGTMMDFIKGVPNSRPDFKLPVIPADSTEIVENAAQTKIMWFGHSAFLLQVDGKTILIDPMLGDVPAPHPLLGKKRYADSLPIAIEKLPVIDAIIISHDHYDHLDYGSIQKLMGKTNRFYVPLGVKAHFIAWGVPDKKIEELDWWDETSLGSIKLAFTPSRHFSGRGLTNRFSTLWGSWVITGEDDNIYFSGDGGYGPHFKEIGEKYGPFDFAMMECGQYNKNWKDIHMMPEETAQAAVDVQAKLMMPIHWGAFTLALHSWTDPIERVQKKATELRMPLIAPKIGEQVILDSTIENYVQENWWVNQ